MTNLVILGFGDSLSAGNDGAYRYTNPGAEGIWPQRLTSKIAKATHSHVVSTGFNTIRVNQLTEIWSFTGAWSNPLGTVNDRAPYGFTYFSNNASRRLTFHADAWGRTVYRVRVYYVDDGGNWQYSINGGPWINHNQFIGHTHNIKYFDISATDIQNVQFRPFNGASAVDCYLVGAEAFFYNSFPGSTVIYHSATVGGSALSSIAPGGLLYPTPGNRLEIYNVIQPDIVILEHLNDINVSGETTTIWGNDFQTFIDYVAPTPVIIISPWEVDPTYFNITKQIDFRAELHTVAAANPTQVSLIDFYTDWYERGVTSFQDALDLGWLQNVGHNTQEGHKVVAERMYWFLHELSVFTETEHQNNFEVGSSTLGGPDFIEGVYLQSGVVVEQETIIGSIPYGLVVNNGAQLTELEDIQGSTPEARPLLPVTIYIGSPSFHVQHHASMHAMYNRHFVLDQLPNRVSALENTSARSLHGLNDVFISNELDGDLLLWNATDQIWNNTRMIGDGSIASNGVFALAQISTAGTYGDSANMPIITIDDKGRVVDATTIAIVDPDAIHSTDLPLTIADGGTGQTTQQTALDAIAGAVTSARFLRGDGTHVTLSAIQAADVPTLNQNTTGTASNVTGTVAIGNGGTGQTTAAAAFNALSPNTTQGDIIYRNATTNTNLAAGTANYGLITGGSGANPSWKPVALLDGTNVTATGSLLFTYAGIPIIVAYRDLGSAVASGNALGIFGFGGAYNSSHGVATGAAISVAADGDWSSSSGPSRLLISTAAASALSGGVNTLTQRILLDSSGNFAVGTSTTYSSNNFYVSSAGNVVGQDFNMATFTMGNLVGSIPSTNIIEVKGTSLIAAWYLARDNNAGMSSGNTLATFGFRGSTDASHTMYLGAAIQGAATQAWTGSNAGTKLLFFTTPNGTHTITLAATFEQDQTLTLAQPLPIASGGTSGTTAAAGFDALAPTSARGDVIYRGASSNSKLAAGTSGYVLTTLGSSADPAWSPALLADGTTVIPTGSIIFQRTSAFASVQFGRNNNAALSNTNVLAQLIWRGSTDGSGTMFSGGAIQCFATQAWTGSNAGTAMDFYTTPNNTHTLTLAMRLGQDQSLLLAGGIGFNGAAVQALTGWAAPTATLSRAAITNASNAAAVLQGLAALITDLRANGVIG